MNSEALKLLGIGENFTRNQAEAATRGGNIIVSAGAGSGKTTVMIARIINKILSGEKLEHMLIVTFTRSAAADMRVKLSKKLAEVKAECKKRGDVQLYARAAEASDAMSVCNIGTLHGYCQRLIKRYYGVAGVDPAAAVCEDGEAELIKRDAVADAVADGLQSDRDSGDGYFCRMYEMLSGRKNDDGITDVIKKIVDFALSMPDPDEYLADASPDSERFGELDKIFEDRVRALRKPIAELKADLIAAKMDKHVAAIDEFEDYARGMIDSPAKTTHAKKLDETDLLNERFLALKGECKACRDLKLEFEQAKSVNGAPYATALLAVARAALADFEATKKRLNKLDYSDLEHGAFRILKDGECAREIMRSVKHVFIDEFQDVNPLQYEFMRVFKSYGAQVFVVGDIKQSIYGFRRCSPQHFKNETDGAVHIDDVRKAEERGEKRDDSRFIHIPLTDNFRSSAQVVDFINGIFDECMSESFGGADYKGRDRLVCGRALATNGLPTGARAELVTFDEKTHKKVYGADVYSVTDAARSERKADPEAEFIARAVEQYILFQTARTNAYNARVSEEARISPSELGQIAVLMRTANDRFCAELACEFDKRKIRYCFGRKSSVKSYAAAVALTDILRCVDNGFDDVALYTALRSPMGGFSDAELARIAEVGGAVLAKREKAGGDGSHAKNRRFEFWQKAEAYYGEYSPRLKRFFELRRKIAEFSQKHDCGDTLGFITSQIDYFQHVYETGGNARAVEALIEYAAQKRLDVHWFLSYYDSADFELELDGGSDAVNITTVHSSKGLEYEFVIVADAGREFNYSDIRKRIIISENGVAVKIPDIIERKAISTAPYEAERAAAPDKLKQEELRLFYVALTRAKNKLIVCGKSKPTDKRAADAASAKRPLDFALIGAKPTDAEQALLNIANDIAECKKLTPNTTAITEAAFGAENDPAVTQAVKRRCENIPQRTDVPIKACVTSLAHAALSDEYEDYTLAAPVLTLDDRALDKRVKKAGDTDVRLRGTAYHRAMELIDFDRPDYDGLEDKCENFELVDVRKIERAVEAMKLMTANKRCFKERYFIVDMPQKLISGGEGSVLVQGIIDLMIIDGNDVTIIDYKTGDPKSLVNDGYAMQLRLYAHAVEKATGGKYRVKKAYLYSFESGQTIEVSVE